MRIAHGMFTWQDGRTALEPCLRSTAPYVDHILIADGLIEGVPSLGLPLHSDLAWLADPSDWLPDEITISSRGGDGIAPWPSLSSACNYLLDTARRLDVDWLLFVDADQELHNGRYLHDWLRDYPGDTFPLERVDNVRHAVPWQCVRVSALRRYIAGCFVAETTKGEIVGLLPNGQSSQLDLKFAPWISHHPERRPPGRRNHRLGDLEIVLEPPPPDLAAIPSVPLHEHVPVSARWGSVPTYYCAACGARYSGPGVCRNDHPPGGLVPLPAEMAA